MFVREVVMKTYNGEKAIISLTSWKARIKTVGLTIFNLITNCPGFHIVLVLSEEEFPRKESELPEDLKLMSECNKIEILWVKENTKVYKKVLYTISKYPNTPVISADDDVLYHGNYAEELYLTYLHSNKRTIIAYNPGNKYGFVYPSGPWTLYPPNCFGKYGIECLTEYIINMNSDDSYYSALAKKLGIKIIPCETHNTTFYLHDAVSGISDKKRTPTEHEALFTVQYDIVSNIIDND